MVKLHKILKLVFFILFISSYLTTSSILIVLQFFSFERARKYLIKNISLHSKLGLKLFNIKVDKKIEKSLFKENYLIVSNHLTYLDILIISSVFPSCFVTSYEMKETPFLGQLCLVGGCLFVERRSKKGLSDEIKSLTNALKNNLSVTIFPEATSTNGEQVLKFRRPLFQAAIDSNKKILPICLNYKKINNRPITLSNRDNIFWYGKMTFFPHFMKMLEAREIVAELSVLPIIEISSELTKNDLAENSYINISNEYQPIIL